MKGVWQCIMFGGAFGSGRRGQRVGGTAYVPVGGVASGPAPIVVPPQQPAPVAQPLYVPQQVPVQSVPVAQPQPAYVPVAIP